MAEEKKGIGKLVKAHVMANEKLILAILGDILISIIVVLLYTLNFGWNFALFSFVTLMAIKPYLIMLINILSKGEVKKLQIEFNLSKEA